MSSPDPSHIVRDRPHIVRAAHAAARHAVHSPHAHHRRREGLLHRLLHPFLHPHLRRHIHLGSLNLTVGAWQLLLWAGIVPVAWVLYRYIYRRRSPRRGLAYLLLGAVVALQASAFLVFALSRNADLLFAMLWLSLVCLLAGVVLLPQLRIQGGRAAQVQS